MNNYILPPHPKLTPKATIVVGMSGGVDSSVTATILKAQGYNVIGMFMKNWEEEIEGVCTTAQDFQDVVAVCSQLNIPYYTVNFSKKYQDEVFSHFLSELKRGRTPNPDILCNRYIKFQSLLEAAIKLGADILATGHYAKNVFQHEQFYLAKAQDLTKDQSYFLYTISQNVLNSIYFPLGEYKKTEIRKIAEQFKLSTATKKDSTGICFIGERNFRSFLNQYIAYQQGPLVPIDTNQQVGTHNGVAFYTIGQRKGLGIGGQGDAWFVVDKDAERNIVYVAQGSNHPALFADMLWATQEHWITEIPTFPVKAQAKIRYRQPDQHCVIYREGNDLRVEFDIPQRAITPEQSIVFYQGTTCLGGATIEKAGLSYFSQKKPLPLVVSP